MIKLELQDEERDVLAAVLDSSLSGLSDEISHTDASDYKDFHKERKEKIVKIRKMLHSKS